MTNQPAEKNENAAFEPTDRVENFLIGLIAFLQHFLITLRDLAFHQIRISEAIQNQNTDVKYTKPVTFITIISFLAIRIFRFGVLMLLLAVSVTGCEAETYTETHYPSFLDELKIPSFSDILIYGIPTLIIVLLISRLLRFILLKSSSNSGKALVTITYYAVGFQYVAYLFLFSLISLIIYLKPEGKTGEWVERGLLYGTIPFFLLWGIFVFYRLVSKTIINAHLRVSLPFVKEIWQFLWALLLMASTTFTGGAMAYSLAKLELREYKPKPILAVGFVNFTQTQSGTFIMHLLVRNNDADTVWLRSAPVYVFDGKLKYPGLITDSCMGPGPLVTIELNQVCWVTVSFDQVGEVYDDKTYNGLLTFSGLTPKFEDEATLISRLKDETAPLPTFEDKSISAYIRVNDMKIDLSQYR